MPRHSDIDIPDYGPNVMKKKCASLSITIRPQRDKKNVKKVGEGVGWVGKCMGSIVANKRLIKAII